MTTKQKTKQQTLKMNDKKKAWEMCNKCGDYEYCAGNYGTDKCTGFIPGDPWNTNEQ